MSSDDSVFSLPLLEHFLNFAGAVVVLAIFDHFILSAWLESKSLKPSRMISVRWFFVHAFANFFVCISALKSVYILLSDPVNASDFRVYNDVSFFGTASVWPLTIVNAVHVYHMIGGFGLSGADYFHHLLFIPPLGFPGQVFKWGATEGAGAFFISGLPGGIAYFLLGLQKLDLLTNLTEKRITANLNTWCRVPGILINSWVVYQAVLYGNCVAPAWAAWLHVFLPPYNALFYNKQAIGNFAVHYMTNLLAQDKVVKQKMDEMKLGEFSSMTGASTLLTWKESIAIPQQGC